MLDAADASQAPCWTSSRLSVCTRSCGSRQACKKLSRYCGRRKRLGAYGTGGTGALARSAVGLGGGASDPRNRNAGRFRASKKRWHRPGRSPAH